MVRFGGMSDKGDKEPPMPRLPQQRHELPSTAYPMARGAGRGGGGRVEAYVSRQSRGGSRYRGPSQRRVVLVPALPQPHSAASEARAAPRDEGGRKRKRDADTAASSNVPCANAAVKYATEIGAKRPRSLARTASVESHPSRGGSKGYPISQRIDMVTNYINGMSVPKSRIRSIQRWLKNGLVPLRQTGNAATGTIQGEHLFLLAIFKLVYPQASRPQCSCFIAVHSSDGRVLTNGEVTKCLECLNMTSKKGSTTAYQAFSPKNIYLHHCFWNFDAPAGVNLVSCQHRKWDDVREVRLVRQEESDRQIQTW